MSLDEHVLDGSNSLSDEQLMPTSLSKKSYMAPKLLFILSADILNNVAGGGDGDAASAHS